MKPQIFSCNWARWSFGFGLVRLDHTKLPIRHPYIRWIAYVRFGPLGIDGTKTFYKKEN